MKDFLRLMICELVSAPENVVVNEMVGQNTTMFEVSCNKGDVGKIIGKGGKTIECIRHIMIAVASKSGTRINIEILE